jgi:hypothetical protein
MSQFFVRFKAHLSRERPHDLPETIHNDVIMEVKDAGALKEKINTQIGAFISMQAFLCWKNQDIQDQSQSSGLDELLVPFRLIDYIDTETKPLTLNQPIEEELISGTLQ